MFDLDGVRLKWSTSVDFVRNCRNVGNTIVNEPIVGFALGNAYLRGPKWKVTLRAMRGTVHDHPYVITLPVG